MSNTHNAPATATSHSHSQAQSHEDLHHFQQHVKKYLFVFYSLIVGTVITVAASYLPIDSVALTVAIALFIACIKGFLVAGYFMHLMSEKKMIYGILLATVFFFVGLMALTIWSMDKGSFIHVH